MKKVLDDPVLGVWNGGLMSVDIAAGFDRQRVRVPPYFIVKAESSSAWCMRTYLDLVELQ